MTKFSTPCFVRVKNPQERKELIEWMGKIGITFHKMLPFAKLPMILSRAGHAMDFDCEIDHLDDAVDCGDNISLFKALAAMNDENDREQWFIEWCTPHAQMIKCSHENAKDCFGDSWPLVWEKATAEEIINYFKNKRS